MIEIERKFLVRTNAFKNEAHQHYAIAQGFLNTDPERTVRVRLKGDKGYITVKGNSNSNGTTRFEWEKEITIEEARTLLTLCKAVVIKTRYEVQVENHIFEVDVFEDTNEGLIVAEVELNDENELFSKPDWLGEEVTGQPQYYNSQLSIKPYKTWQK